MKSIIMQMLAATVIVVVLAVPMSAAPNPGGSIAGSGVYNMRLEDAPLISMDPASFERHQFPDGVVTKPLAIANDGGTPLEWEIDKDAGLPGGAPEPVDWFDDFESYQTGSQIHGQGGWKGWFNDPTYGAIVTDIHSHSPVNSVEIVGLSDLVHEYSGYDTGFWRYTAWQYVPDDFAGESYFILLNQYDDSGAALNWSTQVQFNADQNLVIADASGETLPLIRGQWVELRVEIDLVNDSQEFYYDGQLLYQGPWTTQVDPGDPGILNIGAVDLFANLASAVYYDDLSLTSTLPPMFATHVRIFHLPGPHLLLGLVRMATGNGSTAVGGATVDVEWFLPPWPNYPIPQSRPTNANGFAFPIMIGNWDGTYVLDLVGATHPDYAYDPDMNWESSATITLP